MKRTLGFSVRIVSFITIPAAIGIVLLRQPIVRVRSQTWPLRSRIHAINRMGAGFLRNGIPAISAGEINRSGILFHTRHANAGLGGGRSFGAERSPNIAFLMLFFSHLRNGGPALATVIAAYANCAILFIVFRQRYGRIGGKEILVSSGKALAASAVMGAVCWAVVQYAHVGEHDLLSVDAALLAATIGGAAAIYLALTWILRSVELKEVYEIIFHRQVAAADISGNSLVEVDPARDAFLNYIRVERGLSANTIDAYGSDMYKFSTFLIEKKLALAKVQRDDVVEFLSGL